MVTTKSDTVQSSSSVQSETHTTSISGQSASGNTTSPKPADRSNKTEVSAEQSTVVSTANLEKDKPAVRADEGHYVPDAYVARVDENGNIESFAGNSGNDDDSHFRTVHDAMDTIRRAKAIFDQYRDEYPKQAREVLVLYQPENTLLMNKYHPSDPRFFRHVRIAANRCGRPVGYGVLEDLDRMDADQVRCFVLPLAFRFSEKEEKILREKVCRCGNTSNNNPGLFIKIKFRLYIPSGPCQSAVYRYSENKYNICIVIKTVLPVIGRSVYNEAGYRQ